MNPRSRRLTLANANARRSPARTDAVGREALLSGIVDPDAVFVVIAAYDEAPVIAQVIADAKTRFPNVVVVDDGSSDDTAERALAAQAVVLRHAVNLGQGAALQTGIAYALREGAAVIGTLDADGQHCAADLERMTEALLESGADVALGSRFLGRADGLPFARRLALMLAVAFTRRATGLRLTDVHNGLRVFTASAARRIRITYNGMAHASEILDEIARLGLRHIEVPVSVRYTGYSLAKGQRMGDAIRIMGEIFVGKVAR
jgi:polyprenyl-phospho-N-acetylgalactosaminyl synthase